MERQRVPVEIDPEAALDLLGRAEFGRVAFVVDGAPVIRPLNHVVLDGRIFVFTRHTSAFARAVKAGDGIQVAYEADEVEPDTRLGWSVLVAGTAVDVSRDPHAAQIGLQVESWMRDPLDMVIAVDAERVSGLRLVAAK